MHYKTNFSSCKALAIQLLNTYINQVAFSQTQTWFLNHAVEIFRIYTFPESLKEIDLAVSHICFVPLSPIVSAQAAFWSLLVIVSLLLVLPLPPSQQVPLHAVSPDLSYQLSSFY